MRGATASGTERAIDAAWELVRRRNAGHAAQLYVSHRGRVLADRGLGCSPGALFWTFSVSKPLMAAVIYRLAATGLVDLDAPVAHYWPQFARAGKAHITIRQVLRHRTGMPLAGTQLGDALAMPWWRWELARIERAHPHQDPGAGPSYQWIIYGYILGEVARRVTGTMPGDLEREMLFESLGMDQTHLGVPPTLLAQCVPLASTMPLMRVAVRYLNTARVRGACIPSAGLSTTARSLGRFYEGLLRGEVLSPQHLAQATTPSSLGQADQLLGVQVQWGQGFQLGGPGSDAAKINPMGRLSTPQTFGGNGSGCCIAWADPTRDLVVVYLTNLLTATDAAHQAAVADAILKPLAPGAHKDPPDRSLPALSTKDAGVR